MKDIKEILWFDGAKLRPFGEGDEGRAFKWILTEKDERLILIAMPDDTGLDFHKELRDTVCRLKGWRPDDIKILGGGARLKDGEILHKSTFFGEMPKEYREATLSVLRLK